MQDYGHPDNPLAQSIGEILQIQRPKWMRFVSRMVGNPTDAEDVLQEAVRKVLSRAPIFECEDQIRMYLNRAVCNGAVHIYHQKKRDGFRLVAFDESACPRVIDDTPHSRLEESEHSEKEDRLIRLLREGLAELPVDYYEAVRLTVLESDTISIRQAVARVGIPYSTLRHRSAKGLQQLRRYVRRRLLKQALRGGMKGISGSQSRPD